MDYTNLPIFTDKIKKIFINKSQSFHRNANFNFYKIIAQNHKIH